LLSAIEPSNLPNGQNCRSARKAVAGFRVFDANTKGAAAGFIRARRFGANAGNRVLAADDGIGIRSRISRFKRHPDVTRMATVVLVKIMMVALNFTFIAVAARALDIVGFGNYSILF